MKSKMCKFETQQTQQQELFGSIRPRLHSYAQREATEKALRGIQKFRKAVHLEISTLCLAVFVLDTVKKAQQMLVVLPTFSDR